MFKGGKGITEVPVGHPLSSKKNERERERERFFSHLHHRLRLFIIGRKLESFLYIFLRAGASHISREYSVGVK
jgi:hypothetical protein